MAIQTEIIQRVFKIQVGDDNEEVTLPDPDPTMTPKQVRDHYSMMYPHITSAVIGNPKINKDGKAVYSINPNIGERG